MEHIDKYANAMVSTSSRIQSMMLFQIGTFAAALFALFLGEVQLKEARETLNGVASIAAQILPPDPESKGTAQPYIMGDLEAAWAHDVSVLNLVGLEYPQTHLSKVSELLLTEVVALSCIAVALDETGGDVTKLESIAAQLGALSQQVNQIRQGYYVLYHAASSAIEIEQMTYRQLERYAEYLELEKDLNGGGEIPELWTVAAKLTVMLQTALEQAQLGTCIKDILDAPRVRASLAWGQSQLTRSSERPGDFITFAEEDLADKYLRALIYEDDGETSFVSPRNVALRPSGGWPFEEQEILNPEAVRQLAKALRTRGLSTIEEAQSKALALDVQVASLTKSRSVDFDLIGVKIPYRSAWVLLLANTLLLISVFHLRARFETCASVLKANPEALKTTLATLPYPVHTKRMAGFWLWKLHHDTIGLFGLSIVTCAIYAQTFSLSAVTAVLAYAVALAITLRFWSQEL